MRWWDENVSANHGGNRKSIQEFRTEFLKTSDAEKLTGISQVQVSRWRKKLKDREKYQAELLGGWIKNNSALNSFYSVLIGNKYPLALIDFSLKLTLALMRRVLRSLSAGCLSLATKLISFTLVETSKLFGCSLASNNKPLY